MALVILTFPHLQYPTCLREHIVLRISSPSFVCTHSATIVLFGASGIGKQGQRCFSGAQVVHTLLLFLFLFLIILPEAGRLAELGRCGMLTVSLK